MGGAAKVIDKDRGWRALFKAIDAIHGETFVKVGVLADEEKGGLHETDPETGKSSPLTVAEIAVVLEFGTKDGHIPERSFVRSTFDEHREELYKMAVKLTGGVLDGKVSVGTMFNALGAHLAALIKKKITDGAGVPPPNAPSTAMRKARTGKTARLFARPAKGIGDALAQAGALAAVRPLVDTGRMLGAITWQVTFGSFSKGLGGFAGKGGGGE